MKIYKINPGYFPKNLLLAYSTYLKINHEKLPENQALVNELVDIEISIRGYSDCEAQSFFDINLSDMEILFLQGDDKRIPVPQNTQVLWAQHKYSVLARNNELYKETGKSLAGNKGLDGCEPLAEKLGNLMFTKPEKGGLLNSILHMWGYLPSSLKKESESPELENMVYIMEVISDFAINGGNKYLNDSTALSDLLLWARYYSANR